MHVVPAVPMPGLRLPATLHTQLPATIQTARLSAPGTLLLLLLQSPRTLAHVTNRSPSRLYFTCARASMRDVCVWRRTMCGACACAGRAGRRSSAGICMHACMHAW